MMMVAQKFTGEDRGDLWKMYLIEIWDDWYSVGKAPALMFLAS